MKLSLSRIAEFIAPAGAAAGQAAEAASRYDGGALAQGYSIDSRTIEPGELFFAVKGERLDGHDFVEQALGRGAIAAVVRKGAAGAVCGVVAFRLLAVDDTLIALQTLATAVRKTVGQAVDRRDGLDGQDDDEGSDGAFARRSRHRVLEVGREISTIILGCR